MIDRREQILFAAIALFEREGFWNTSTAQVAKEAGVATGTLFNYFPTKSDLIDQVFSTLKSQVADAVGAQLSDSEKPKDQLWSIWMGYFGWACANPVHRALLTQLKLSDLVSQSAQEANAEKFKFAFDTLERGVRDGTIRNLPVVYLAALMEAHLEATVSYAINSERRSERRAPLGETGFETYWKSISL